MKQPTVSRTVTVTNPQGLHARPASLFAQMAGQFQSQVELVKDGERVDGKSILSILTLAAGHGSRVSIEARGDDAEAALKALADLVERGFPAEDSVQHDANIDQSETG